MASGITLLSLQLFWFPFALAAQLGCSAYIWGVSIVLVSGILCHGSDWWYRPVRGGKHETVIALAWLDRSCVFAAILFCSTASFSVSISWLAAFLCISAAGFIYFLLVPGRNGELWHTALHLAATFAMCFSILACRGSRRCGLCEYCGPEYLQVFARLELQPSSPLDG